MVPGFAAGLDAGIRQLHADECRNATSVSDGPALLVGADTSGAKLALELAASHEVLLRSGLPLACCMPCSASLAASTGHSSTAC